MPARSPEGGIEENGQDDEAGLPVRRALAAAGLTAAADAQFDFSYSAVSVLAYAYGVSGPSYESFFGAGFWSIAASEPGAIATSDSDPLSLEVFASADPGSVAYSYDFISYFTVGSDVVGTASWDFDSGDGTFIIENITDGVNLLDETAPSVGSAPIALEAGKDYALFAVVYEGDFAGNGSGFARLVIPAPSTAALLGLAGLAASRRRR